MERSIDFEENSELLKKLEIVFLDGGSFGFGANTIPLKYYRNNDSKLKILLKLAFPSREYLKKCYSYYEKNPFLYPVARVNRITDGLFKRRRLTKKAINQLKNGTEADASLELINELEIITKE